jgi:hypothetical protein
MGMKISESSGQPTKKWLVYNDEDNKMYCTLCKNSNVDSIFTIYKGNEQYHYQIRSCQAA